MNRIVARMIVAFVAIVALTSGCNCRGDEPEDATYSNVMIYYADGYNNLAKYMDENIDSLKQGWIPKKSDKKAIVIAYRRTERSSDYSTATSAQLIWMYKDSKSKVVMDTLKTYSSEMILSDAASMKTVLNDIKTKFNSERYGLIFSSHGSGWIPEGYYNNPDDEGTVWSAAGAKQAPRRKLNIVPDEDEFPDDPPVKSIGGTYAKSGSTTIVHEMELADFASALPYHLDYIVFDACLMGGIEVAYELKDATDAICFSQAEILAYGMDYKNISERLLRPEQPDLDAVADDYFQIYNKLTGSMKSATISVVDCKKLGNLATVCSGLFEKYRTQLDNLDPKSVQVYFRSYHHWYYDLEDMLVKAGISSAELSSLKKAMDGCITYKNATEGFIWTGSGSSGFPIDSFSGLSMYLPNNGSATLDAFYKTLAWNKATGLVD